MSLIRIASVLAVLTCAMPFIACSAPAGKSTTQEPPVAVVNDGTAPVGDQPTADASVPSATDGDSSAPVPSSKDAGPPTDQASCIVACESAHPASAKLGHTLDATCMLGTCEPVCNGLVAGKNYPPDADAGALCDTAKAASYPILTPSEACSTCLASTPSCCSLWISIFGSADGQALNTCANKCYTTFSK